MWTRTRHASHCETTGHANESASENPRSSLAPSPDFFFNSISYEASPCSPSSLAFRLPSSPAEAHPRPRPPWSKIFCRPLRTAAKQTRHYSDQGR
ncbi:hypothetical protein Bca4012_052127 [Brassica carinata]|uniref:(rape) hypothetical protein n=1 Tax=Brassica napus TaxID=3708 RepID=A0A816KJ96_BRANA|nr:unnamed protein product [Brassica napus]